MNFTMVSLVLFSLVAYYIYVDNTSLAPRPYPPWTLIAARDGKERRRCQQVVRGLVETRDGEERNINWRGQRTHLTVRWNDNGEVIPSHESPIHACACEREREREREADGSGLWGERTTTIIAMSRECNCRGGGVVVLWGCIGLGF